MLQLILGRTGTGKTTTLLSQAAAAARAGKQVLVIVPEQFSFATERKMLAELSGKSSLSVSVLSFSRLCENIFRTFGGLAGKRLTDMARLVLMKLAVQEAGDSLELYGRQCQRTDFLTTMLQTVEELKSSGSYPAQLRDTLAGLEKSQLRAKLTDITTIYEVYQSIVERSYQDPLDDIARGERLVRGSDYFAGCAIFVDGFSFFSPPERALVETMLEQSDSLTLALAADRLAEGGELDLFRDQKKIAHRLIQRANELGISCKKPLLLTENLRAQNEPLLAVESFLSTGIRLDAPEGEGVQLVRCADKYDEIRFAAAEITRLVRDCGYRYRDIALVCRNLSDYQTALETTFAAYQIPLFFDRKEQVTSRPVVAVLLAALDAVRGDWKTEAILRIARCPASGVLLEQAAQLENYAYLWSLEGKEWAVPLRGSPSGLSGTLTELDKQQLAGLEAIRNKLFPPLAALKKSLKSCTGSSFALALYQYLLDADVLANLKAYYAEQPDGSAQLDETDRLYNMLLDILDLLSDAMRDTGLAPSVFIEMFELATNCIELGQIPNTNDQTIAGGADRIRLDSPRAVFAIGVNEGVFPARFQSGGIFSDTEREQLVAHGVELSASQFQRALLERFYLYSALAAPRERLYVTYSCASLSGAASEPSLVVSQLAAILPNAVLTAGSVPPRDYVADLFTAREQYLREAAAGHAPVALAEALRQEGDGRFLSLMERIAADAPAAGITRTTAHALLGGKIALSPTKVESFYRCPYLYFCDSMLHLRKRKRVEYTPLESGSAIHYVLEQLLKELGGRGISELPDNQLEEMISRHLSGFIATVAQEDAPLQNRFKYQFKRLVSVLLLLLRRIGDDFAQSLFTPVGMEVTVAEQGTVKPITITASDGTNLVVNGKIDRVDLFANGEERYVRVVDYKSGGKEFNLDEVFYGLNMQMLLYLFALCNDQSAFGKVQPAGILYMPGNLSAAEAPPGADTQLIRSLLDDTLKMKGLLLEDETVLRAMERELAGKFIPVKANKSGGLGDSAKVKSAAEFAQLKDTVTGKVAEMGEALISGGVEPMPIHSRGLNPCDYCDYGVLCGNRNTKRFRAITAAAGTEEMAGDDNG